jgi:hypothetical protein
MQETCCGKISILRSAQKKISTLSGRFIKTALKGSLFLLYAQEPLGKAFSATAFPSLTTVLSLINCMKVKK